MNLRPHVGRMSKYPLEWGWETPETTRISTTEMSTPRETLPGRRPKEDGDIDIASSHWGDRKCQGYCASGGDSGTTGAYEISRRIYCRKCAVKKLGIEDEPSNEQNDTLERYELKAP
jgi:hypothetical protein